MPYVILSTIGGGGLAVWECFTNFDAYEKESVDGTLAFFDDCTRWTAEHGLGMDFSKLNEDTRLSNGYQMPREKQSEMYSKMGRALKSLLISGKSEKLYARTLIYGAAISERWIRQSSRNKAGLSSQITFDKRDTAVTCSM